MKALFKKVFGAMQPPVGKETVAARVRRLKPFLRAELRRGLTFEQLSQGLATDDFNLKIGPSSLRRIMAEGTKPKGALAAQARANTATAAGTTAAPA